MHLTVRLKHWFFRHFGAIASALTVGGAVLVAVFPAAVQPEVLLPGTAAWLSLIFFVQKQRLEELLLFTNRFQKFNARYDKMNGELMRIARAPADVELTEAERGLLIDYFNLCGEEYLFYREGYILPDAWDAWLRGMQWYFARPRIQRFWLKELEPGSYYGLTRAHLETDDPALLKLTAGALTEADADAATVPAGAAGRRPDHGTIPHLLATAMHAAMEPDRLRAIVQDGRRLGLPMPEIYERERQGALHTVATRLPTYEELMRDEQEDEP